MKKFVVLTLTLLATLNSCGRESGNAEEEDIEAPWVAAPSASAVDSSLPTTWINPSLAGTPRSVKDFSASPNPLCSASGVGAVKLSWRTEGVTSVHIRVGNPGLGGGLFAWTGASGSKTTGPWITDGIVLYLQDASNGNETDSANTLARLTVRVRSGAFELLRHEQSASFRYVLDNRAL